jgi:hypothetical protein
VTVAEAEDTNVLAGLCHDVVTNSETREVNFFDAYTHASTLSQSRLQTFRYVAI